MKKEVREEYSRSGHQRNDADDVDLEPPVFIIDVDVQEPMDGLLVGVIRRVRALLLGSEHFQN